MLAHESSDRPPDAPRETPSEGSGALPPVQAFGENELADRLRRGGEVGRFLVSIGNPRGFLSPKVPGTRVPELFRERFERVLRLSFFDVDDEEAAGRALRSIRPEARPLQRVVRLFDDVLGSRLSEVNEGIRAARIEEMRIELDLREDALLEELPAAE
ncbi:MAG: hypothetical protein KBC36_03280 [Spirochaetia bacterium]|nr:hypothetical protein [Spirochaetia bacterium]